MKATTINKKTIIGMVAALVVITVLVVSFGFNRTRGNMTVSGNIPVSKLHGSFSINFDNINELVGDADYVFVGAVISEDGTEYKHPVMGESEDGEEYEIASPYTNYTISVLDNIKGELVTDTEIPIQKAGGLAQDGSQYFVYEEDELPKQGSVYVFYAYAQPDGSLLVSGPNSNEKINVKAKAVTDDPTGSLETISAVQEVIDALDTQVETGRTRFVSTYDANQ
ncbi:MAG TPA: hypothetical protein GX392_02510 [Clostridiales bacterium]|nr:hypothetical protein [Clostridiales bacterium]